VEPRNAVVVGGGSGIGAAVARALAADGCRVTVADVDAEAARAVATALDDGNGPAGRHGHAVVDVSDEPAVEAMFDAVVARAGAPEAVVNCAGVSTIGLVTDLAVEEFRRVVDVDLTGGFLVLKHAGRRIRDGGAIVTLTSLNARQPGAGLGAYCAAKAGLAMLVQVAALELAERRVRVNAVSPGLVETPLTAPALEIPGIAAEYLENTPLGRAGTPDDVAALVRFLCSAQASWLTGEVVDLTGGAHLRRYPDLLTHIRAAYG
jgi:3-oxoacyl-[acyl-carrier protein] reductase